MIDRKVKRIWIFLGIIGLIALMGAVTMLLWNWLIPSIFDGVVINFWQASGLLILAKLFFGGFGPHHFFHAGQHMHHRMNMSKDDRREMIRRHMASHGWYGCNQEKEEDTHHE